MTASASIRFCRGSSRTLIGTIDGDVAAAGRWLRSTLPAGASRRSGSRVTVDLRQAMALAGTQSAEIGISFDEDAQIALSNRAGVAASHQVVHQSFREILEAGAAAAYERLPKTEDLLRLDSHQVVNVAVMTLPDAYGACIFDEQGVGKSLMVIEAFDVLATRHETDRLIIVAPKSMLAEWLAEFGRFKPLYRVAVVTGSRRERLEALHSDADVLVANFETVASMLPEFKSLARRGQATLAVDESFFVKNHETLRTAAVADLREWCGRTFVLCGTPAPNAPHDVVAQFDLVDFGLTFSGVRVPDDRDLARPVIRQAMEASGIYTRNVKATVLPDLPTKRFTTTRVAFSNVQGQAYQAALGDLVLDLRQTTDEEFGRSINSYLERRSKLLQICSNPAAVVPGYAEIPAKLLALDDLLADLIGQRGEKVVVWSYYTASLEAVLRRYERYQPVRYDGSTTVRDRGRAIECFQKDDSTMLFVANPAAGGAGVTLHRARTAIYESFSQQAAHFLQSLDRIHRRGQEREVEYFILICDGSIEEAEYERLLRKERAQRDLLGDVFEPAMTRERLLAELLGEQDLVRGDPR